MIRDRAIRKRDKLVAKLPVTGELLRGSLLERTVRHTKDCPKCAPGEGHRVFVVTVTYAGGRVQSACAANGSPYCALLSILWHSSSCGALDTAVMRRRSRREASELLEERPGPEAPVKYIYLPLAFTKAVYSIKGERPCLGGLLQRRNT
jgi:hypothetical protein